MIDNKMTRGVSVGALAALLSGCGHLPIAEPAFEAMAVKRAGMPADWTVAPMTGDPAAAVADYSVFQDAQLIAFVQEALENNLEVRFLVERGDGAHARAPRRSPPRPPPPAPSAHR
jgi:outer membrane protein TolC